MYFVSSFAFGRPRPRVWSLHGTCPEFFLAVHLPAFASSLDAPQGLPALPYGRDLRTHCLISHGFFRASGR